MRTGNRPLNLRNKVLLVLLLGLFAVVIFRAGRNRKGVIIRNRIFGSNFLQGKAPYFDENKRAFFHGPYPPSFSLVACPLSLVPLGKARILWASIQCVCLCILLAVARKWAALWGERAKEHSGILFASAVALCLRFLLRDTAGGGGNLVYSTLAVLSIYLSIEGREFLSGIPFALAVAVKPTLIWLFLFFVFPRPRSKTILSITLFSVLFARRPGVWFGMEGYLELFRQWVVRTVSYLAITDLHSHAAVPEAMPKPLFAMNQSLREAVFRLFRPPGDTMAHDVHLVLLPSLAARLVSLAMSIGLIGIAINALLGKETSKRTSILKALSLFPLCLLLSPISWKAHHVALIMPFFYIILILFSNSLRPRWVMVFLLAYFAAISFPGQDITGREIKNLMQAVSIVTWGNVFLLLTSWNLTRNRDLFAPDGRK